MPMFCYWLIFAAISAAADCAHDAASITLLFFCFRLMPSDMISMPLMLTLFHYHIADVSF